MQELYEQLRLEALRALGDWSETLQEVIASAECIRVATESAEFPLSAYMEEILGDGVIADEHVQNGYRDMGRLLCTCRSIASGTASSAKEDVGHFLEEAAAYISAYPLEGYGAETTARAYSAELHHRFLRNSLVDYCFWLLSIDADKLQKDGVPEPLKHAARHDRAPRLRLYLIGATRHLFECMEYRETPSAQPVSRIVRK